MAWINYRKQRLKSLVSVAMILLLITLPITTSAVGNIDFYGSREFDYKDGNVLEAAFRFPYGITMDKEGNLIVADSYNNIIRKIKENQVTTVAGFSEGVDSLGFPRGGYVDEGVKKAQFNRPRGVAVDSRGDIFVVDTENHAIRKITSGQVYTFAGTGEAGYKDGKGDRAQFNTPLGIMIDEKDNLFITDTLNHVIRKVTPQGEVSTYAGKTTKQGGYKDGGRTTAEFNEPSGIAIDQKGTLYVLDSGNQLVRKITDQQVTTLAGKMTNKISDTNYYEGDYKNASTREAMFNFPKGIDLAEDGTIFIADTWNHRIRAIKPTGEVILIAGDGTPDFKTGDLWEMKLNSPVDLVYASGKLYVSDSWNNIIRVLPIDLQNLVPAIEFEDLSEKIQIWVDGKKLVIPDVEPYIEDGRTLVPFRFICEEWGAEVSWLEASQQVVVTKEDWSKTLTYEVDPIILKDGRTMVHLRYLAESMNFKVDWMPEYRAVVVTTK